MKSKLIGVLAILISIPLLANFVFADMDVTLNVTTDGNVNVGLNTSGNVDVTIDGTNIGQEITILHSTISNVNNSVNVINDTMNAINDSVNIINENVNTIYNDVYGSSPNTPDHFLLGAENATTNPMSSYCSDPLLQSYFNTFSATPPAGFKQFMKDLGYDDEAHINLMWTICIQQKLDLIDTHMGQNEASWSSDTTGISYQSTAAMIESAINWLLGKNKDPSDNERRIAISLDSYFTTKQETYELSLRVKDLEYRVEALENTMKMVANESFCLGQLEVLEKYELESVTCGGTLYHNHMTNPANGENMIIALTNLE